MPVWQQSRLFRWNDHHRWRLQGSARWCSRGSAHLCRVEFGRLARLNSGRLQLKHLEVPERKLNKGQAVWLAWTATLSVVRDVPKETNLLRSPYRTPYCHTGLQRFPCPQDSSSFLSSEKWFPLAGHFSSLSVFCYLGIYGRFTPPHRARTKLPKYLAY